MCFCHLAACHQRHSKDGGTSSLTVLQTSSQSGGSESYRSHTAPQSRACFRARPWRRAITLWQGSALTRCKVDHVRRPESQTSKQQRHHISQCTHRPSTIVAPTCIFNQQLVAYNPAHGCDATDRRLRRLPTVLPPATARHRSTFNHSPVFDTIRPDMDRDGRHRAAEVVPGAI